MTVATKRKKTRNSGKNKKVVFLEDTKEFKVLEKQGNKLLKKYKDDIPYETRRKQFEQRRGYYDQFVTVKKPASGK